MIDELSLASQRDVSRETLGRLERFRELICYESERQNLIGRSTIEELWSRHILDSAQLCRFGLNGSRWLDVGSGAGLPGMVLAILLPDRVTLVEPRRLRAEFLQRCVSDLELRNVEVIAAKVERVDGLYDVITARAVAALHRIFALTHRLSQPGTRWVLPKGRSGAMELAEARRSWQGDFRVEPSITEGDAVIVLAEKLEPRRGRRGEGDR